jgi:hypothetical protein
MNEWELQNILTQKYYQEGLNYQGTTYKLVCWELMFPSWGINDNKRKWNEPSIDFIFYSAENLTFLCVELKNVVKAQKDLLSAYCQVTDRAIRFQAEYSIDKITKAHSECMITAREERGQNYKIDNWSFSEKPNFARVLMAISFPKSHEQILAHWNSLTYDDLLAFISGYSSNKEFDRFRSLSRNHYASLSSIQFIEIGSHLYI